VAIVSLDSIDDLSGLSPMWEVSIGEYRYVLYSGNRAQVFKGDSSVPAYEVTESGCSCPAAQYGNTACKHRAAISWVGDGVRAGNATNQVSNREESETNNIVDTLL
jgi:hypothetical protein